MNATLNPNVLRWARSKAGFSEENLADKIGVHLGAVKEWETSGSIPFSLVETLAEITHTAFGFLFLQEPPKRNLPINDFRRVHNENLTEPTEDLLEIIYNAQLKQSWYREHLIANGEKPLPFVGSASLKNPSKQTADDIRKTLGIGSTLTQNTKSWEEALSCTIEAIEDAGILFLRAGYAGGNTRRKLAVEEFRGFAISDEYAPLIFINGADAPTAQMFTLAHELAHIWVGESGISNLDKTYSIGSNIEAYCNRVAAEVLLPLDDLRVSWKETGDEWMEIDRLSKKYKISGVVVARRAHDEGFLSDDAYSNYYKLVAVRGKSKGGTYYLNSQYQNSRRFSVAIIQDARAGRTLHHDAMRLLGIKKDDTFRKYAQSLQLGF